MYSLLFHFYLILSTQFMPVDKIKQGMTGYGLTVFKGTQIDTFQVEVIDVMYNIFPRGNVVLARISGKVVDTAGVIAGMSGSPIYLFESNNKQEKPKLIGALAYAYGAFTHEPLAGITPIDEMLNPPNVGYMPQGKFSPIKIPMNCPGLSDEMLKELGEQFPCFNFMNVQSSSKISDDSLLPEPGSSIGVPLVQGDVTWCGVGTCTYREGNKVWGFGHTMATLGKTELPMTTGYIYSVISSSYNSYKMGASTGIIGTITSDNTRGISGIIGKSPELINFNIKIEDEKFHYELVKEKSYLPFLFASLTRYSFSTGFKGTGDLTSKVNLEVKGSTDFHFENLYTGSINKIIAQISNIFNSIQDNPFQKIDITEISINLVSNDTVKIAKVDELWINKKTVKPNDTLNLLISLYTYQEGTIKKQIPIIIPSWAKKGELWLKATNGTTIRNKNQRQLRTIDELAKWLAQSPKNNELIITLSQKGQSGWVSGKEFQSLPPSKASFIKGDGNNEIFKLSIPTEWVITKEKSIKLEVK